MAGDQPGARMSRSFLQNRQACLTSNHVGNSKDPRGWISTGTPRPTARAIVPQVPLPEALPQLRPGLRVALTSGQSPGEGIHTRSIPDVPLVSPEAS